MLVSSSVQCEGDEGGGTYLHCGQPFKKSSIQQVKA